jgi:ubiquinone/menaquinone biosynthesis C-methylase UbiE
MSAILDDISMMNGKVLEVGYGKVNFLMRRLPSSCTWYGTDPRYSKNDGTHNRYGYKVSKMEFQNEFFDCVLASQTIEHWGKFGDSIEAGLKEIHRVLKKDGLLFIDVPIHSHGAEVFCVGDPQKILALFSPKMWKIEKYDERRKEYDKLPPYEIPDKHKDYAIKYSKQAVPSSWLLNIVLKKI